MGKRIPSGGHLLGAAPPSRRLLVPHQSPTRLTCVAAARTCPWATIRALHDPLTPHSVPPSPPAQWPRFCLRPSAGTGAWLHWWRCFFENPVAAGAGVVAGEVVVFPRPQSASGCMQLLCWRIHCLNCVQSSLLSACALLLLVLGSSGGAGGGTF